MNILSILSQKGGTGKTTLAINLAVTAARHFDGRVTLISLTARGREAQTELLAAMSAHFWNRLRPLDTTEKQTLIRLLKRLRAVLGDHSETTGEE